MPLFVTLIGYTKAKGVWEQDWQLGWFWTIKDNPREESATTKDGSLLNQAPHCKCVWLFCSRESCFSKYFTWQNTEDKTGDSPPAKYQFQDTFGVDGSIAHLRLITFLFIQTLKSHLVKWNLDQIHVWSRKRREESWTNLCCRLRLPLVNALAIKKKKRKLCNYKVSTSDS